MKKNPFPVGLVVTLTLLWIGALGAIVGGWVSMRQMLAEPATQAVSRTAASTDATASRTTGPPTQPAATAAANPPRRLVWSPEAFWRFAVKAGSAALGALLFLLLAVGAGFLLQEQVESSNE